MKSLIHPDLCFFIIYIHMHLLSIVTTRLGQSTKQAQITDKLKTDIIDIVLQFMSFLLV